MSVRPAYPASPAGAADTYSLCGVGIEVSAPARVAALIGSRLRFLRSPVARKPSVIVDIRAEADEAFAASPDGPGRPVYNAPGGQLLYFEEQDQLFIDYPDDLRVLCSPASGLVQSAVVSERHGSVLAAYPFFTLPLTEVMKRRGRFPLHAGCVAREGRGLLLAGTSGSGKSTLTAALVSDGWEFLSDDMVLVVPQGGATLAWGCSHEIGCSDETAAMVSELRHLIGGPTLDGRDKHAVDVQATFGVLPVPACPPHALVLPTISGERRSVLQAVSPADALRELVPNILLTERAATQAHLDALAKLVSEIPCYSLATGTDFLFASRCLQEILQ